MNDGLWPSPPPDNDDPQNSATQALPAHGNIRWVRSRKSLVLQAIENGFLSEAEALDRYNLSSEELHNWREHFRRTGEAGLSTTALLRDRRS